MSFVVSRIVTNEFPDDYNTVMYNGSLQVYNEFGELIITFSPPKSLIKHLINTEKNDGIDKITLIIRENLVNYEGSPERNFFGNFNLDGYKFGIWMFAPYKCEKFIHIIIEFLEKEFNKK